ncbi:hypothetical protein ACFC05_19365, partial [Streptomyces hydrogenans]
AYNIPVVRRLRGPAPTASAAATLPAAGLVGAAAEFLTKQGTWGIAVTAALLIGGSAVIWALSRRQPVDHHNVTADDLGGDDSDSGTPGVVTTAIAAVTPPPAGSVAAVADDGLKTTIHAPGPNDPAAPPAPAAAV